MFCSLVGFGKTSNQVLLSCRTFQWRKVQWRYFLMVPFKNLCRNNQWARLTHSPSWYIAFLNTRYRRHSWHPIHWTHSSCDSNQLLYIGYILLYYTILYHTWYLSRTPRTLSVEQIFPCGAILLRMKISACFVEEKCSTLKAIWLHMHFFLVMWRKIAPCDKQFCSTLCVSS